MVNVHELWSCILKVINFLSRLPYFGVKFGHYFNFGKLPGWREILKILLKMFHNIFKFTTKFHEFWRCILGVMKFWTIQPCLVQNLAILSIFVGCRFWGKFWNFYHRLLVSFAIFLSNFWILGAYFFNGKFVNKKNYIWRKSD